MESETETVAVKCPFCGAEGDVPKEFAGQVIECPKCGKEFIGETDSAYKEANKGQSTKNTHDGEAPTSLRRGISEKNGSDRYVLPQVKRKNTKTHIVCIAIVLFLALPCVIECCNIEGTIANAIGEFVFGVVFVVLVALVFHTIFSTIFSKMMGGTDNPYSAFVPKKLWSASKAFAVIGVYLVTIFCLLFFCFCYFYWDFKTKGGISLSLIVFGNAMGQAFLGAVASYAVHCILLALAKITDAQSHDA